jgi:hypothetical protein
LIVLENNVLSRCPRTFKAIVPGMLREEPNKRIVCRPLVPSDSLMYQYQQLLKTEAVEQPVLQEDAINHQEILVLHNKAPIFEPSIQAYCQRTQANRPCWSCVCLMHTDLFCPIFSLISSGLNFHGRANIASVKNFQLVNC